MPTVSEFWDGRAQNYDAQVGASYAKAYEMTAERFKQYLKPTDAVLDFACGTGIVTLAVAPAVKSVRAIDVSGEMVRRAQEKTETQGMENVTVTQTDLFDTCLAEESFDAVLPAMCCFTSRIEPRRLRASARCSNRRECCFWCRIAWARASRASA